MTWFIEGGPMMYAILITDLLVLGSAGLAFVLAVGSRFAPRSRWVARGFAGLVMAAAALPLLEGALGWYLGHVQVQQAVEFASDEHREAMRAAGEAIAMIPAYFGGASTLALGLLALFALVTAAIPHSEASA